MAKYKILAVDDEADCLEFVAAVVEDMDDCELVTASNGQEGIDTAKAEKPDLIIMDVMMPQKDGYTAFSELKQDPEMKDTPIVMFSSMTDLGEYVRYNPMPVKPNLFLDKPIDPAKLAEMVTKVLKAN